MRTPAHVAKRELLGDGNFLENFLENYWGGRACKFHQISAVERGATNKNIHTTMFGTRRSDSTSSYRDSVHAQQPTSNIFAFVVLHRLLRDLSNLVSFVKFMNIFQNWWGAPALVPKLDNIQNAVNICMRTVSENRHQRRGKLASDSADAQIERRRG
jgi:hypothetical protein